MSALDTRPAAEERPPGAVGTAAALRDLRRRRAVGFVLLVTALIVLTVASVGLGARDIAPGHVVRALLGLTPPGDYDTVVIFDERFPRTLLGIVVGACLGASGVLMQGVTHNPLVDGGILGVELGAACAIVVAILVLGISGVSVYFWFALLGAGAAMATVWLLARASSVAANPAVNLVICGAAVSALLAAVINLLIVRDEAAFAHYRFWSVGQLTGRAGVIDQLWPIAAVALVAALLCAGVLNAVALGLDTAAGLGVNVPRALLLTVMVAVLLCAVATASVGPVPFVGLVGAHVARLLFGADHRWVIPTGMGCGAALLLAADVLGRLAPGNGEISVGVMTALVGTPIFILLARRRRVVEV